MMGERVRLESEDSFTGITPSVVSSTSNIGEDKNISDNAFISQIAENRGNVRITSEGNVELPAKNQHRQVESVDTGVGQHLSEVGVNMCVDLEKIQRSSDITDSADVDQYSLDVEIDPQNYLITEMRVGIKEDSKNSAINKGNNIGNYQLELEGGRQGHISTEMHAAIGKDRTTIDFIEAQKRLDEESAMTYVDYYFQYNSSCNIEERLVSCFSEDGEKDEDSMDSISFLNACTDESSDVDMMQRYTLVSSPSCTDESVFSAAINMHAKIDHLNPDLELARLDRTSDLETCFEEVHSPTLEYIEEDGVDDVSIDDTFQVGDRATTSANSGLGSSLKYVAQKMVDVSTRNYDEGAIQMDILGSASSDGGLGGGVSVGQVGLTQKGPVMSDHVDSIKNVSCCKKVENSGDVFTYPLGASFSENKTLEEGNSSRDYANLCASQMVCTANNINENETRQLLVLKNNKEKKSNIMRCHDTDKLPYYDIPCSQKVYKMSENRSLISTEVNMGKKKRMVDVMAEGSSITWSSVTLPKKIPGGFKNLTNIPVDREVEILLSYGPKFVPPLVPTIVDVIDLMEYLSAQYERIYDGQQDFNYVFGEIYNSYYKAVDTVMTQGVHNTGLELTFYNMLDKTRQFLSTHKEVCVVQSDKSRCTTLMLKNDYLDKMYNWVSKCEKAGVYQSFTENYDVVRVSINATFKALRNKLLKCYEESTVKPFSIKTYFKLKRFDVGAVKIPCLYGVVKDHKEDQPCRPICSTLGWYTYPLQQLVSEVLGGLLKDMLSAHNVKNINHVVYDLHAMILMEGYVFVKFDIHDMYTSMNKSEILRVLGIFLKKPWFKEKCAIPPNLILSCLYYSFSTANFFTFQNDLFRQIRGLPQGACDSGLLATIILDIYLEMYESDLFVNNYITYWWKYIDDFLIYLPKKQITKFQDAFEEKTSLKLTIEDEVLEKGLFKISFLDIEINRDSKRLFTCTYVKECASRRMVNYLSNYRKESHNATVIAFLKKILMRTSNIYLKQDLDDLYKKCQDNNYPITLLRKLFSKVLVDEVRRLSQPQNLDVYYLVEKKIEDIKARLGILRKYYKTYDCGYDHSVFQSDVGICKGRKKLRTFVKSIKYVCEEFCDFLVKVFHYYGLGYPSFAKGETLFSKLRMSLKTHYQGVDTSNIHVLSFVAICDVCGKHFIIMGVGSKEVLLSAAINNTSSPIGRHADNLQHLTYHNTYILACDKLSLNARQYLYKALLETVGIGCEVEEDLVLLPRYLKTVVARSLGVMHGQVA